VKVASRYASAPPTRPALAFYALVRGLISMFFRLVFRMRIRGTENMPAEGAFILAPGAHQSNLDTLAVCMLTRRRLRYMGKDTLWRTRFWDWFFSALGGFPVNRDGVDREALRQCLEFADSGEPVVMFPEGTRHTGPEVGPLHDGPAYVASRAGVPIVPVGIGGSARAMPTGAKMIRPFRMSMIVGAPIDPPSGIDGGRVRRSQVQAATDDVREVLQVLFEQAQDLAGVER